MWCLPFLLGDLVVLGHACSDHGCGTVARWRCFWPGQTRPKCDAHRIGWERVATVMGFELRSEPLPVRTWPEPDDTAARFALLELT